MRPLLEVKLPEDVMDKLSSNKDELIVFLSKYFDDVINSYESRLKKRVRGPLGSPLSRYERANLKDFLMDETLGPLLGLYEEIKLAI